MNQDLQVRKWAEQFVLDRLAEHGIKKQATYRTGEAAKVLGVSRETVRQMCLRFEPEHIPGRDPSGIFSGKPGKHHKIPHNALVDHVEKNTTYQRLIDS